MSLKPIKLWSHTMGPNPWKVAMVMAELDVPYVLENVDLKTVKQEPFISVNPNGRVPAIEDPNTGLVLWESGAIIEYLVATYDKDHKISHASGPEVWLEKQWLHFQMSGQGPYFGQAMWFLRYHPEKVPSAVERYANEMKRVTGVLDKALAGKEWLVGSKCTYADISFLKWYAVLPFVFTEDEIKQIHADFPSWSAWMARLEARPAIAKTLEDQKAVIAAANH